MPDHAGQNLLIRREGRARVLVGNQFDGGQQAFAAHFADIRMVSERILEGGGEVGPRLARIADEVHVVQQLEVRHPGGRA